MPPYMTSDRSIAVAHALVSHPPIGDPPGSGSGTSATDDMLAVVLIRMWELASGRRLRDDVAPHRLSEEELISFWADDFTPSSGRHRVGIAGPPGAQVDVCG